MCDNKRTPREYVPLRECCNFGCDHIFESAAVLYGTGVIRYCPKCGTRNYYKVDPKDRAR